MGHRRYTGWLMSRRHPTWDLVSSVCEVYGGWMNEHSWQRLCFKDFHWWASLSLLFPLWRAPVHLCTGHIGVRWWWMALWTGNTVSANIQMEEKVKETIVGPSVSGSVGRRIAAFTSNRELHIKLFLRCFLLSAIFNACICTCIGTVVSWVWLPPLCWQRLWGKQEMEHGVRSANPWLLNHGAAIPKSTSPQHFPLNGYVCHRSEAADVWLNSNFRLHVCFISFSSIHPLD